MAISKACDTRSARIFHGRESRNERSKTKDDDGAAERAEIDEPGGVVYRTD